MVWAIYKRSLLNKIVQRRDVSIILKVKQFYGMVHSMPLKDTSMRQDQNFRNTLGIKCLAVFIS